MRQFPLWLGTAAVLLFSAAVVAQSKPDFSGRWASESEAAPASPGDKGRAGAVSRGGAPKGAAQRGRARGDMGSGWGQNITITQDASRLTVEYAFFSRNDMQPPLKFVYPLDGSETKNSVMMGRGIQTQTSKTAWDGEKLVITTTHPFDDPSGGPPLNIEVTQTLSLETPTSLVVETTRGGVLGGKASTTRTVYTKR